MFRRTVRSLASFRLLYPIDTTPPLLAHRSSPFLSHLQYPYGRISPNPSSPSQLPTTALPPKQQKQEQLPASILSQLSHLESLQDDATLQSSSNNNNNPAPLISFASHADKILSKSLPSLPPSSYRKSDGSTEYNFRCSAITFAQDSKTLSKIFSKKTPPKETTTAAPPVERRVTPQLSSREIAKRVSRPQHELPYRRYVMIRRRDGGSMTFGRVC